MTASRLFALWCHQVGLFLLLDLMDLFSFCRPVHIYKADGFRRIEDWPEDEAYRSLRFTPDQLRRLLRLWRVLDFFYRRRHKLSGETCMLMFLATLGTGMTYIQLADCWFGGDPRILSDVITNFVEHLFDNFGYLVTGDSLSLWLHHNVDIFRDAIFNKLEETVVVEEHWRRGNLEDQYV